MQLLSVTEAVAESGRSREQLLYAIRTTRTLRAMKLGPNGRDWRIEREQLERFLRSSVDAQPRPRQGSVERGRTRRELTLPAAPSSLR